MLVEYYIKKYNSSISIASCHINKPAFEINVNLYIHYENVIFLNSLKL